MRPSPCGRRPRTGWESGADVDYASASRCSRSRWCCTPRRAPRGDRSEPERAARRTFGEMPGTAAELLPDERGVAALRDPGRLAGAAVAMVRWPSPRPSPWSPATTGKSWRQRRARDSSWGRCRARRSPARPARVHRQRAAEVVALAGVFDVHEPGHREPCPGRPRRRGDALAALRARPPGRLIAHQAHSRPRRRTSGQASHPNGGSPGSGHATEQRVAEPARASLGPAAAASPAPRA